MRKARGEIGKLKSRKVAKKRRGRRPAPKQRVVEVPAIGRLAVFKDKAAKTDPVEFLRRACGFDLQPWQALVIRAMMEDKL